MDKKIMKCPSCGIVDELDVDYVVIDGKRVKRVSHGCGYYQEGDKVISYQKRR